MSDNDYFSIVDNIEGFLHNHPLNKDGHIVGLPINQLTKAFHLKIKEVLEYMDDLQCGDCLMYTIDYGIFDITLNTEVCDIDDEVDDDDYPIIESLRKDEQFLQKFLQFLNTQPLNQNGYILGLNLQQMALEFSVSPGAMWELIDDLMDWDCLTYNMDNMENLEIKIRRNEFRDFRDGEV